MAGYYPYGLDVRIISGANMLKMDLTSKSDPYVVLSYDDDVKLHKTRVIDNNQNPVWNQEFPLDKPPANANFLWFTVFDDDPITPDDCMGMAQLRLGPEAEGTHTLGLMPKRGTNSFSKQQKNSDKLGTLTVAVRKLHQPRPGQNQNQQPGGFPLRPGGPVVTLTIHNATGLAKTDVIGSIEPYVKVFYASSRSDDKQYVVAQSPAAEGRNPVWAQATYTLHPPPNEQELLLQLWDKDLGSPDDFLGQAVLPLSSQGKKALPLYPRRGNNKDRKLVEKFGTLGVVNVTLTVAGGTGPGIRKPHKGKPRPPDHERRIDPDSKNPIHPNTMDIGHVKMKVVRAYGLVNADIHGADPYVLISFEGAKKHVERTQVVKKSRSPVWNHEYQFRLSRARDDDEDHDALRTVAKFTVMDQDLKKQDDFMGMAFLVLGYGMDGLHKLSLMPRPNSMVDREMMRQNKGTLGTLEVEITSRLDAGFPPFHKTGVKTLYVTVLNATGLPSQGDPFVTLSFTKCEDPRDRNVQKTERFENNPNPVWEQDFRLPVPPSEAALHVQVWDFDKDKDDLIGEARVPLTGRFVGPHTLVLKRKGQDERRPLGHIRINITDTQRLYDYDDCDDGFSDDGSSDSLSDAPDFTPDHAQPVSRALPKDSPEVIHRLAEMWRTHEATESVLVALPLDEHNTHPGEEERMDAYREHLRLKEEADRLRLQREKEAGDQARQRDMLESALLEEQRLMAVEKQRVIELAGFHRISLQMGRNRFWKEDVVVAPNYYDPHYLPHWDPIRTTAASAPSSPSKRDGTYKSPYTQQPYHPHRTPRPPPKNGKHPPKPLPKVERHVRPQKPGESDEDYKNSMPITLRDNTAFSRAPASKRDYYFNPDGRNKTTGAWETHDPRNIGHSSRARGIPFEKMSLGRAPPFAPPAKDV